MGLSSLPSPVGPRLVSARSRAELEAGLPRLRAAPPDVGRLTLLVRRPSPLRREVLAAGRLDGEQGLVGDYWRSSVRPSALASGSYLSAQLNVMGSRMVEALAEDDLDRAEAGDQLYLDLDLSHDNLPAGSLLRIGDVAEIEVTAKPHRGCRKFTTRFGAAATAFVNSPEGRALRLRGLNARVVTPGDVRPGDAVRVVGRPATLLDL